MRTLLLILTLIITTSVNSQSSSNEIIVDGSAKMKVRPDVAVFELTMEKRDSIEKNATNNLNVGIEQLVASLNKIGFTNNSIRIADYEVSSETDDDDKKRYTASNTLKVEFRIDNKIIDAFYGQVQQAGIEDLDISFDTKLSDSLERASRSRLVQFAIQDAKASAGNISRAADIRIGRIKQVRKSDEVAVFFHLEEVKFAPPKIVADRDIAYKTSFDNFQVDDVELEERITIIYEILSR